MKQIGLISQRFEAGERQLLLVTIERHWSRNRSCERKQTSARYADDYTIIYNKCKTTHYGLPYSASMIDPDLRDRHL